MIDYGQEPVPLEQAAIDAVIDPTFGTVNEDYIVNSVDASVSTLQAPIETTIDSDDDRFT